MCPLHNLRDRNIPDTNVKIFLLTVREDNFTSPPEKASSVFTPSFTLHDCYPLAHVLMDILHLLYIQDLAESIKK